MIAPSTGVRFSMSCPSVKDTWELSMRAIHPVKVYPVFSNAFSLMFTWSPYFTIWFSMEPDVFVLPENWRM